MEPALAIADFSPDEANRHQHLEAVGEKLADVMHDVAGPLSVILGFAELMAEEPDEAERHAMLEEVLHQVRRITAMRDQTLAYARGKTELLKRQVHVHALAHDIEATIERALEGTHILCEVTAEYRGPAELDDTQLLRAVDNIVRNAREAMAAGKGSRFLVDIARDREVLLLSFTDDGPGIPDAVRGHVFEPVHATTKQGGNGLGLGIVQKVAQHHGGTAHCFSQEGVGTRIELRLPVLPEEDPPQLH